jgi:hypothetical protein
MAKKKTPGRAGPRIDRFGDVPSIDDYRHELVRLVRRQLDCARDGTIGTPAWKLAFGADIDRIRECEYWTKLPHPVPELTYPGCIKRGEKAKPEWSVIDSVPAPMAEREWGLRFHTYTIDATKPDALQAVNQLAARVIPEWLKWMKRIDARARSEFQPASYFKGIGLTAGKLRDWVRHERLKDDEIRELGSNNLYEVDAVMRLVNIDPKRGRMICKKDLKKRAASGRS